MKRIILGFFIYLFSIIFLLCLGILGMTIIFEYGPSEKARNLFVTSVLETSALKFLANDFMSEVKIKEIIAMNSVEASTDVTNGELVTIDDTNLDKIEFEEVNGPTFHGYMVIVHDPSRLAVGVSGAFKEGVPGKTLNKIAEKYNATVAINGGGFSDDGGVGDGGIPTGIVIANNKLVYGSKNSKYDVIGFDNDNKLVVGNMTGEQALDRGIRDALSFGPILIVNGTKAKVKGTGGGLNPRTAIGQRTDGAVLLLVIEGRRANSLGASYEDVMNVMSDYQAINAANLDGGSSSLLYYDGKYINNCASLYGPRRIPTSFVVR